MQAKQVIVIRRKYYNLNGDAITVRRGKECAQCAHGSCVWLSDRIRKTSWWKRLLFGFSFSKAEKDWLFGSFKKIVLQVDTEEELLAVYEKAKAKKLTTYLITDSGLTEFEGIPTHTVVAIGPHYDDAFDGITNNLKLY